MKKVTVSVGIPAYNEEANIQKILRSILEQQEIDFTLKEILVISDKSNDMTVMKIKELKNRKIRVLENKKRMGQALSQNRILESFNGDILVLLNADVLPANDHFLANIIKPIFKNKTVGLVGAKVEAMPEENHFERIINFSSDMKSKLYENLKRKNNIYLCHGRARAFSKDFAKSFEWKPTIGEDAFSYFSCITNGFKFVYAPNAKIKYRSPQNLKDHLKQSVRFLQSRKAEEKFFPEQLVKEHYHISATEYFQIFKDYFIKNPILFTSYVMIFTYAKVLLLKAKRIEAVWNVSQTSKSL